MKPIAVILFILFWILLVSFLAWKNSIGSDLSEEAIERNTINENTGVNFGHPLWQD